jgi:hypothetical protein
MVRYKIYDLAIEYEKIFGRRKGAVRGRRLQERRSVLRRPGRLLSAGAAPLELGAIVAPRRGVARRGILFARASLRLARMPT